MISCSIINIQITY